MTGLVDKLLAALRRYPLRTRAYPAVLLVLGYAVHRGWVDLVSAETAGTLLAVVLGVKRTERHTVPVIRAKRRRRKRR